MRKTRAMPVSGRPRSVVPVLLAVLVAAPLGSAQRDAETRARWNRPVESFRLIGNLYYVGTEGLGAYLIAGSEGAVLLDGGLPESAPVIADAIAALGFRLEDVKVLVNSHAHFDHAGGLAELKRRTGAVLLASAGDAPALRRGGEAMPPVEVDRIVEDGESVRLGDVTLVAHVTPGHTRGCTSWSTAIRVSDRDHRVYFHCSTSVVDRLVGNAAYPSIVRDYERTFARLRAMQADVFLANHPQFFDLAGKRARMLAGEPNPFVDPTEVGRFVAQSEREFREALAKGGG